MNTNAVAKKLGVSPSTVGRWVRQLNLEIKKNEYGHFIFSEDDIRKLKEYQLQLQKNIPDNNIKEKRTGIANITLSENEWLQRLETLERKIEGKADRVVSYQLLQHRQELENLTKELTQIQNKLTDLSEKITKLQLNESHEEIEKKKKTPIWSFFR